MALVLIVEDEPQVQEMLTIALQDEGYEVLAASNGQQGLERLESLWASGHPLPNLIISDFMMPVLDGIQMFNEVQASPVFHDIPFVLITAAAKTGISPTYRFHAFVHKPFDLPELLDIVAQVAQPA